VLDLVEEMKLQKILSILDEQPSLLSTAIREQLENIFLWRNQSCYPFRELSTKTKKQEPNKENKIIN
jgi:hypothetical protein